MKNGRYAYGKKISFRGELNQFWFISIQFDIFCFVFCQITNYGIGGVYTPHLDSVGNNGVSLGEPYLGDRLATFLSFMTDVKVGGGTAFPFLGVTHQPKKGDAILWYVDTK